MLHTFISGCRSGKSLSKMRRRSSLGERAFRDRGNDLVLRVRGTESVSENQQKIVQNVSICIVNHAGGRTCVVVSEISDYFHLRRNRGATRHQACLIKLCIEYINSVWNGHRLVDCMLRTFISGCRSGVNWR
jgi:hypothetical protein